MSVQRTDTHGRPLVKCRRCSRVEAQEVADERRVRTGRCGHCGGDLEPDIRYVGVEPEAVS